MSLCMDLSVCVTFRDVVPLVLPNHAIEVPGKGGWSKRRLKGPSLRLFPALKWRCPYCYCPGRVVRDAVFVLNLGLVEDAVEWADARPGLDVRLLAVAYVAATSGC